jgi:predicted metalloprotease with PDZ domain
MLPMLIVASSSGSLLFCVCLLPELQTDHKRVMASIERTMFALHAEAKAAKAAAHPELIQSVQQVRSGGAGAGAGPAVQPSAPRQAESDVPPAAAAADSASSAASSSAASAASLPPFYVVNSVSEDSPASVAGLRAGDLVLQFGSVTAANKSAASMAAVVSSSVGRALHVTVKREKEIKQLRLIPQAWGGRGMLGCHLVDV